MPAVSQAKLPYILCMPHVEGFSIRLQHLCPIQHALQMPVHILVHVQYHGHGSNTALQGCILYYHVLRLYITCSAVSSGATVHSLPTFSGALQLCSQNNCQEVGSWVLHGASFCPANTTRSRYLQPHRSAAACSHTLIPCVVYCSAVSLLH